MAASPLRAGSHISELGNALGLLCPLGRVGKGGDSAFLHRRDTLPLNLFFSGPRASFMGFYAGGCCVSLSALEPKSQKAVFKNALAHFGKILAPALGC